ncbi:hypothetical protein EG835_00340 [bacterium]|nr:hypothetical protein [bacterium]
MRISRRSTVTSLAIAALLLTATAALAAAPPLTFTAVGVATGPPSQHGAVMDGRYVAYERFYLGDAAPNDDMRFVDLADSSTGGTAAPFNQSNPDLSYDLVVYDDDRNGDREIYLHDITEGTSTRITTQAGNQTLPRISNHLIVWRDVVTNSLWYRDLMRDTTNRPIPDSIGANYWDVDGDTVVFTILDDLYKWPVTGTDMGPEYVASIGFSFDSLRTHAGRAAFTIFSPSGRDVTSVSLTSGDPTAIDLTATRNSRNADLFHKGVVWQQDGAGNENLGFNYLGETGWANVGVTNEDEIAPSLFGRRVAFQRWVGFLDTDIFVASASPEASRTSGANRYQTAIETSKAYFDSATNAVICTGRNFPDALTAAPLAKALEAPLLLVPGDQLASGVLDELTRLGVQHVWIIGGEDVVSWGVAEEVGAGRALTRIEGADRYETAKKVAYYLYDITTMSQGLPWYGYAFVARGDAFPDALAAAPVAASINAPILLTRTGSLPPATTNALAGIQTTHPIVLGGSDVVSDAVKNQIQTITVAAHGASPTQRWEGADRYATAAEIVSRALDANWIDLDTLGIATGTNFPDALGGGAALGTYGSPLLLVKPGVVPDPVDAFMDAHPAETGRLDVFGGSDVVFDSVKNDLAARLR